MANNVTGQKKKSSTIKGSAFKNFSINLLNKLNLQKDLSLNRQPITSGRIRHYLFTFRSTFSSFVGANILTLLFFLPLVFVVFFFMPTLERQASLGANLIGDLGFGFTGATNDALIALRAIYTLRINWMALIIPCMILGGLGMAGLFYCCRNRVWGAKISVFKHFFRGVSKYWWQYMSAFTFVGVLVYGIYALITNHFLLATYGAVPAWNYIVLVLLCILAFLTLLFFATFLGTNNMYKMSFGKVIKNSMILSFILIIPAILLSIVVCIPFFLLFSSFTKIIFYIFFVLCGFVYIALAYQEFAQYANDIFTNELLAQKAMQEEKNRRKSTRGSNKKNKRK